jgi:Uma2 family endonuclease
MMSAYDPRHGIPYEKEAFLALIETQQPHRYEWRDGMLYVMPGGTGPHSDLADRLGELFRAVFGWRGRCRVYRDRYVEIPNHTALLPDLVITCAPSDVIRPKAKGTNSATIQYPRLIAEVLSDDNTAVYDRREKRELYQHCPTLEVYLLLDQEAAHVMVYRRSTSWQLEQYTEQQAIAFPEFGLSISLDDLYTDILASVAEALKEQAEGQP